MKIFRFSQYRLCIEGESDDQLLSLKPVVKNRLGRHVRRIDRFTQLALIGASDCKGDLPFPLNTGVIMASNFGSLSNTFNVLSSMFQDASRPLPCDFIHTVSNAASYYLAREFDLTTHNLFISQQQASLPACLRLAEMDINCFNLNAVLIGQVNEVGLPFHVHRARLGVKETHTLSESSDWFLLANRLENEKSIAEVVLNVEGTDAQFLNAQIKSKLNEMKGKSHVITWLEDAFYGCVKNDLVDYADGVYPLRMNENKSSSAVLFDFLQSGELGVLVIVERVNRYKWNALVIKST